MSDISLPAAIAVGVLYTVGIYLLLSANVQRFTLGFLVLANGVNLGVLAASGLPLEASAPLAGSGPVITDPLPQAFVLTAIVIGLGTGAFLIAVALRFFQLTGSDEITGSEE